MSFSLMAKETVEESIKRIVSEEITQAIKEIDNRRLKRSEAIPRGPKTLQEDPRHSETRKIPIRRHLSV